MGLSPKLAADIANQVRYELTVLTECDYSTREITCEECGINDTCEFAWDHYNTDGDCLAIK